jgi:hypothetical protein
MTQYYLSVDADSLFDASDAAPFRWGLTKHVNGKAITIFEADTRTEVEAIRKELERQCSTS